MLLLRELGLETAFAAIPRVEKRGAAFVTGDAKHRASFKFDQILVPGETVAWNVERAPFDRMLLNAAREAGAEVVEGLAVRSFAELADGSVRIAVDGGEEVSARWLVDASGQATMVGRHLGTRRVLPHLKKAAWFGHFENVRRQPGIEGGFPVIVMCQEGWFWLIPLDERRTSIGIVMDAAAARQVGVPSDQMLAWPSPDAPMCGSARRTPCSRRPRTWPPISPTGAPPMPGRVIFSRATPPRSSTRSFRPASAWG